MENIRCIICDRDSDQVIIEENGYSGRKCHECSLIYISPRPTMDEVLDIYHSDQAHASAQSHIAGCSSKRLYAQQSLAIIRRHIKNGSLLEMGSGAGYFLQEAKVAGFDVYGIEPNVLLADFINTKLQIPCESATMTDSSFGGIKFDVVYHCDVLSHLYNPIAEFELIHNRLNERGLMVFETGNLGDVKHKYFRMFDKFQYPDHLFFFSEKSLQELLGRTGFDIVKIYRYSLIPQFLLTNIVTSLRALTKRKMKTQITEQQDNVSSVSDDCSESEMLASGNRGVVGRLNDYLSFFMRYKAGYWVLKKGRPQTVIVVAQKRSG